MRQLVVIAFAALLLAAATNLSAFDGWKTPQVGRYPGVNKYQLNSARARKVYPQYYWGFHARHLQNVGVPTGDQGRGGNGFMLNPW
jgi:hypothetical protein